MPTRISKLAIDGGSPVRSKLLPYGRQCIENDDVAAVEAVLRSDWLTTGPSVEEFESAFAAAVESRYAVSFSSGTAALHGAIAVLDLREGDEIVTTPITFCASANCVLYCGGRPVFSDVDPDTLLIDPAEIERKINSRTKALVVVDYAGQPAPLSEITALAEKHGLTVIEDACHALGATYEGRRIGGLSKMSAFSFHPVKHVTTGEGGMVTTNSPEIAQRLRRFRNHGIESGHRQREKVGSWFYEMVDLGYNYRLTDIQCALGLSQLQKLSRWLQRRCQIAAQYDAAFRKLPSVRPLTVLPEAGHAYHLYVIQLDLKQLRASRAQVFTALRGEGIGVNVHYIPVHLHPYYRQHLGTTIGICPRAEGAYEKILSLPMFPLMTDQDVRDVIEAVNKVIAEYSK